MSYWDKLEKKRKGKLHGVHRENVKGLTVTKLKPKDKERYGQGMYLYLVRQGASSHTAFRTKRGLDQWLNERSLKVGEKTGWGNTNKITGAYKTIFYTGKQKDLDAKAKRENMKPVKVLENGSYVRGYAKKTTRGATIHVMNVNYNPRKLKYVRR